jgi:hypothetical protein
MPHPRCNPTTMIEPETTLEQHDISLIVKDFNLQYQGVKCLKFILKSTKIDLYWPINFTVFIFRLD